ncbi:MAG: methylated-DNA--[protein]-cysteine S-methyltransferase [Deltaproteobacteria bacterium]|jgi:methylated-DNA-[protein]-cysteine S-methyltransferase|nr:methylated-DNA--[protein]-cysteine S-methyltransferase [Deltaproteobacteria bacterium]
MTKTGSDEGRQCVRIHVASLATPIGTLRYAAREGRVCGVGFDPGWSRIERALARRFSRLELRERPNPALDGAFRDYFQGRDLDALEGLGADFEGTPFQRRVWKALGRIPRGRTSSYADLAGTAGRPRAWRAVGSANGRNLVSLVIPCHHVIASDGGLGGYAFGTRRKRWLLEHEGALG